MKSEVSDRSGRAARSLRMVDLYSRAVYPRFIAASTRSDLSLTSDFIVGFPGETDADFDATLRLVEAIRFDGAFSFASKSASVSPGKRHNAEVSNSADRVLTAMKRGYTALEYKSTIRRLRAARPDL